MAPWWACIVLLQSFSPLVMGALMYEPHLAMCIRSLRRLHRFISENEHEIDSTMYVGLFMAKAHLYIALEADFNKIGDYYGVKRSLAALLTQIEKSLIYFLSNLYMDEGSNHAALKKTLTLYTYIDAWHYVAKDERDYRQMYVNEKGVSVRNYEDFIKDIYMEQSSSKQQKSDCMLGLAENAIYPIKLPFTQYTTYTVENKYVNCGVTHYNGTMCKAMVLGERKGGFALADRLCVLLCGERGRMCDILAPAIKQDLQVDNFCKDIYNEVILHAVHNMQPTDLVFEQIAMCSFYTISDFYRTDWWDMLLSYQTREGCFTTGAQKAKQGNWSHGESDNTWAILKEDGVLGQRCHRRATAYAAVVIASAIRYIIRITWIQNKPPSNGMWVYEPPDNDRRRNGRSDSGEATC